MSSPEKVTEPGEKDLYRAVDQQTGLYVEDVKTRAGAQPPREDGRRYFSLLNTTFRGSRRLSQRASVTSVANYIRDQLPHVAPDLLDLNATRTLLGDKNYSVVLSPELEDIKRKAIDAVTPKKELRVLVVPGSFAPATRDGHVEFPRSVNELFKNQTSPHGFDRIIYLPTGDRRRTVAFITFQRKRV